jgi:hypothetical protein
MNSIFDSINQYKDLFKGVSDLGKGISGLNYIQAGSDISNTQAEMSIFSNTAANTFNNSVLKANNDMQLAAAARAEARMIQGFHSAWASSGFAASSKSFIDIANSQLSSFEAAVNQSRTALNHKITANNYTTAVKNQQTQYAADVAAFKNRIKRQQAIPGLLAQVGNIFTSLIPNEEV